MKIKAMGVMVLAVLLASIVLAGCASSFSNKIGEAEKGVEKAIRAEGNLLYDNGKNFLAVNSSDWATAIIVLQPWVDRHPDKRIVSISSDSIGDNGRQSVWLIYYESR